VRYPRLIGIGAFLLALALITAYLPGSPSALIWPYEWMTITVWTVLGIGLYLTYGRRARSPESSTQGFKTTSAGDSAP